MDTKAHNSSLLSNGIVRIALVTTGILLVPVVGNWPWTIIDFVIMGVLVFATGLVYELVVKRLHTKTQRIVYGFALGAVFFLTWAELAVGIFDSPFAGS